MECDVISATGNRDNPLVKGRKSSSMKREFFFSVREISRCYLTSKYPPIVLNNVGHRLETAKCWFVIQTSSTHLSKRVWLGHCMIMWPCCRFINLSLSSWWGFLSCVQHTFSFLFQKINHDKNTQKRNVHCHAYQIFCSALSFFVSQVNTVKIYTVNDFQ